MADLTNKVSATSGALPDRIAAQAAPDANSVDLIQQLTQLTQQQQQLQQQEPASAMGEMGSLKNIIPLILGLGGSALVGGRQGALMGANFASSFMGQKQLQAAEKNQQRVGQMKMLNDSIDSQRGRLIQLLQAQPDMFVDPETMQPTVDPRLLGYASTGLMIPIDPSSNYKLKRRLKGQEEQFAVGRDMFENGGTPELRVEGLRVMGSSLGVEWSQNVMDAAVQGNEAGIWESLLTDDNFTPQSVTGAMAHARRNNMSILDVATMLVPVDKAVGGDITIPEATLAALDEYADILRQNPEFNDPMLTLQEKIELAFPDEADKVLLLMEKFGEGGVSPTTMANQVESSVAMFTMLDQMAPGALDPMLRKVGLSKDDPAWVSKLATRSVEFVMPTLVQMDRENATRRVSSMSETFAGDLAKLSVPGLTPEQLRSVAFRQVMELRKKYTSETGVLDFEGMSQGFDALRQDSEAYRQTLMQIGGVASEPPAAEPTSPAGSQGTQPRRRDPAPDRF